MLTRYQILYLIITLLLASACNGIAQIKGTIWDVPDIYKIPAYKTVSRDSAIGVIYQGLLYKGKLKNVYAYYSSPGILAGDETKDHNLPAVVLVHGGGGTAFKNWAIMWAKKGYAAIAMDLRGNDGTKKHIEGGFDEPGSLTPYFTITPGLNEQWMYQAAADVIMAHNLIRSFKGVDSNRTALTGISWGGVISCLLAGVDNRYKAVVPVYGCGFLFHNSAMLKDLNKLSITDKETWIRQYDPSQYLVRAKMPLLFINGTNDGNFFLDSYAKSYRLVKNRTLSIKIGLKHNHSYGWGNEEIFYFVNSYLNKTAPLPKLGPAIKKGRLMTSKITASVPVDKAYLNYTRDTTSIWQNKKWGSTEINLKNKQFIATELPPGITAWYFSITDKRRLQVSTAIQW
jgi:hypothetical protein